ncbi:FtsL-like putative cell division protein [Xanthovirga aplysinae]|uniref:FtsL-like putative cell division protein n=1 Tax=Xanthovirga aplysinae TaxID=2529853 RepID=UPI0012BCF1AC|nr:FtsL-like putative cell division protein [Xanthovirga aplysinae]MTI32864.1 hypothetical protein [Xanthovirga aplysinae]
MNTYKEEKTKDQNKGKKRSLFTLIENNLRLFALFDDGVPVKYFPHVLFVALIGVFYIGNSHYAERTVREVEKLQSEVEDLRVAYTSIQASYMYASKQSEVAKRVKKLDLFESMKPPVKIVVGKK